MQEALTVVLEIQECDVKMIRLVRLKQERRKELDEIYGIRGDLERQVKKKEDEIQEMKTRIRLAEIEVEEALGKTKRYEDQQSLVKKVDEFNALSREIAASERERANKERHVVELQEAVAQQEELIESLRETLAQTRENTQALENEIKEGIRAINAEGRDVKAERDTIAQDAQPDTLRIYDRLFKNKQNRVVVPIENRTCSGCHIVLTPQHENLVRKGERLVFCEHCSRILYWQEAAALEGTEVATKRRRRKAKTA